MYIHLRKFCCQLQCDSCHAIYAGISTADKRRLPSRAPDGSVLLPAAYHLPDIPYPGSMVSGVRCIPYIRQLPHRLPRRQLLPVSSSASRRGQARQYIIPSYSLRSCFSPLLLYCLVFYVFPGSYCSSLSCFSFRFWVFSSVFRFPHPPRGFFCLLFTRCTQIALHFPDLAPGFGFFRLFFGSHTHHVGFSACFSLATHIRQRNRHAPIRLLTEQQLSMLCLPA